MASVIAILNRLLPFATPGTPLLQDLIHLASICLVLYFAPQIQAYFRKESDCENTEPGVETEDVDPVDIQPDHALPEQDGPDPPDVDLPPADQLADHNEEPAGQLIEEGQPGPVNARPTAHQRKVGAKKAKSLARKDQRRAYHEFQRAQGEAQRAQDAQGAAEREAALAKEKARRKAVEDELEAKKVKERELRRERERREREELVGRTELVLEIVKRELVEKNMCDLFRVAGQVGDDVDEEWVEKVVRLGGVVGKADGEMTMITSKGWVVRVTARDMERFYESILPLAEERGSEGVSTDELTPYLEAVLRGGREPTQSA